MLTATRISKRYGEHQAILDATCSIIPGTVTAFVGPSGSGKSTLLRMLAFLEGPDAGNVILEDGTTVYSSLAQSKPWPIVTCVFQKQFLWPHLSIRQNITLPVISGAGKAAASRCEEIFDMFAMRPFLDRYPNQVSGGEAQRAALARAFALSARYILLDEAHTFLDMEQQKILNHYIQTLKNHGIGFAVVTHSSTFVRSHADRIVVVESGQVSEQGDSRLLQNPTSQFLKSVTST